MNNNMELSDYYMKEVDSYYFIYYLNTGSYCELSNGFKYIEDYIHLHNIEVIDKPQAFIMNDPRTTDSNNCLSEIGYKVKSKLNSKTKDVYIKEIPKQIYMCITYYGDIKSVSYAYDKLYEYITKMGYYVAGIPMEIYLKHPFLSEKDKITNTEIRIPIGINKVI